MPQNLPGPGSNANTQGHAAVHVSSVPSNATLATQGTATMVYTDPFTGGKTYYAAPSVSKPAATSSSSGTITYGYNSKTGTWNIPLKSSGSSTQGHTAASSFSPGWYDVNGKATYISNPAYYNTVVGNGATVTHSPAATAAAALAQAAAAATPSAASLEYQAFGNSANVQFPDPHGSAFTITVPLPGGGTYTYSGNVAGVPLGSVYATDQAVDQAWQAYTNASGTISQLPVGSSVSVGQSDNGLTLAATPNVAGAASGTAYQTITLAPGLTEKLHTKMTQNGVTYAGQWAKALDGTMTFNPTTITPTVMGAVQNAPLQAVEVSPGVTEYLPTEIEQNGNTYTGTWQQSANGGMVFVQSNTTPATLSAPLGTAGVLASSISYPQGALDQTKSGLGTLSLTSSPTMESLASSYTPVSQITRASPTTNIPYQASSFLTSWLPSFFSNVGQDIYKGFSNIGNTYNTAAAQQLLGQQVLNQAYQSGQINKAAYQIFTNLNAFTPLSSAITKAIQETPVLGGIINAISSEPQVKYGLGAGATTPAGIAGVLSSIPQAVGAGYLLGRAPVLSIPAGAGLGFVGGPAITDLYNYVTGRPLLNPKQAASVSLQGANQWATYAGLFGGAGNVLEGMPYIGKLFEVVGGLPKYLKLPTQMATSAGTNVALANILSLYQNGAPASLLQDVFSGTLGAALPLIIGGVSKGYEVVKGAVYPTEPGAVTGVTGIKIYADNNVFDSKNIGTIGLTRAATDLDYLKSVGAEQFDPEMLNAYAKAFPNTVLGEGEDYLVVSRTVGDAPNAKIGIGYYVKQDPSDPVAAIKALRAVKDASVDFEAKLYGQDQATADQIKENLDEVNRKIPTNLEAIHSTRPSIQYYEYTTDKGNIIKVTSTAQNQFLTHAGTETETGNPVAVNTNGNVDYTTSALINSGLRRLLGIAPRDVYIKSGSYPAVPTVNIVNGEGMAESNPLGLPTITSEPIPEDNLPPNQLPYKITARYLPIDQATGAIRTDRFSGPSFTSDFIEKLPDNTYRIVGHTIMPRGTPMNSAPIEIIMGKLDLDSILNNPESSVVNTAPTPTQNSEEAPLTPNEVQEIYSHFLNANYRETHPYPVQLSEPAAVPEAVESAAATQENNNPSASTNTQLSSAELNNLYNSIHNVYGSEEANPQEVSPQVQQQISPQVQQQILDILNLAVNHPPSEALIPEATVEESLLPSIYPTSLTQHQAPLSSYNIQYMHQPRTQMQKLGNGVQQIGKEAQQPLQLQLEQQLQKSLQQQLAEQLQQQLEQQIQEQLQTQTQPFTEQPLRKPILFLPNIPYYYAPQAASSMPSTPSFTSIYSPSLLPVILPGAEQVAEATYSPLLATTGYRPLRNPTNAPLIPEASATPTPAPLETIKPVAGVMNPNNPSGAAEYMQGGETIPTAMPMQQLTALLTPTATLPASFRRCNL